MAQKLSVSAVSLIFVLLSLSEKEAVETQTMLSMLDTEVRQLIGHNAKMSLLCPDSWVTRVAP